MRIILVHDFSAYILGTNFVFFSNIDSTIQSLFFDAEDHCTGFDFNRVHRFKISTSNVVYYYRVHR